MMNVGTEFEHTRNGTTYRYRVKEVSDAGIVLHDYNDPDHPEMTVEPEWFNQRKIQILSHA